MSKLRYSLFPIGCFLALGMFCAHAQTVIDWQGGNGNSNWQTASNWSGNVVPDTSSEIARFDSSTNNTTINQNVSGLIIGQLAYTENAISRTISGNSISLAGYNGVGLVSNSLNTQTIASAIIMTSSQTWQVNSGIVNVTGNISNSNWSTWTKSGAGTLILSGNNTFQGPTIVSAGTLQLASSTALGASNNGNQVYNGAALELTGGITLTESDLTVTGTGVSGNGVLRNISGNNTLNTKVIFGGDSTIRSEAGLMSFAGTVDGGGHTITLGGGGDFQFTSNFDSTGTLIMSGTGTVTLSGSQSLNINTTVVNSGLMVLNHTNANALAGDLVINGGTVRYNQDEQVANYKGITVNGSGVLDLNNHNESVTTLAMTGGTINTGTGTLTLSNAGGNQITSNASDTTATINGKLAFDGYVPVITVARGTAAVDLEINATITAAKGFEKKGAGILKLDQAVTTGGSDRNQNAIVITQGTLLLGASNIIADTTPIVLNGGTLATGGYSDTMGKLTMSANSTIDMGSGSSILTFSGLSQENGNPTLTITNWSGSATGGGTDQIIFTTTPDATFLANVYWADFGTYGAKMVGNEMVPISMPVVPEPGTTAAGAGLVGYILWREWRRRLGGKKESPPDA